MHRRTLPIASPCQVFRPSPGQSFCDHCSTHVHDLSAMTRKDAEALLAANDGRKICVAYRTKADGTIVHRPDPRPLERPMLGAALALGLAACTGHTPEVAYPGEHCKDPHGYEQDCDDGGHGDAPVIPDREPISRDPEASDDDDVDDARPIANGEPLPPTDAAPIPELPPDIDDFVGLVEVVDAPDTSPRVGTVAVDARAIRKANREEKRAERQARRAAK